MDSCRFDPCLRRVKWLMAKYNKENIDPEKSLEFALLMKENFGLDLVKEIRLYNDASVEIDYYSYYSELTEGTVFTTRDELIRYGIYV